MCKAVFFDRDGVINEKAPDHDYIKNWDKFKLIPGIIDVMKYVQSQGYMIIIITNQRGIARGLMTIEDLLVIHENLKQELDNHEIFITDIFFCPHDIQDNCDCRKPRSGMILEALKKYEIDVAKSVLIGDSMADIIAANNLDITSILYLNSSLRVNMEENDQKPAFIITNLKDAINIIK